MSSRPQIDSDARRAALEAMAGVATEPTSLVNYQSQGRLLIIGGNQALEVAPRFNQQFRIQVLLTDGTEEPGVPLVPLGGRSLIIRGYLGAFRIDLGEAGKANAQTLEADLILDLGAEPLIESQLKPPGYLHAGLEEPALQAAMDELGGMIGRFEKPRFFDYDPALCAHGRAGKQACSRCLEACPADAITSLAETIEVNAHLCQGGGVCATVCPSGAIRYTYPCAGDNLARLRRLLAVYRERGGRDPVLLVTAEADAPGVAPIRENQLPFPVEELASLGLEFWLAALAYGARALLLADGGAMPASSGQALREQLGFAGEILRALGYDPDVIRLLRTDELAQAETTLMPDIEPAAFSGIGGKRETAHLAIDHLHGQASRAKPLAPLGVGAPFGTADVDAKACTLCFSCVGACPGHALQTGGEGIPRLSFIEENCLQCGLCTRTCPEDAIWITPRMLFDREARKRPRMLHEEPPFHCTACGKPFATRSVIDAMRLRLKDHHMFQNERARRRLTLCEDCRVIDIVQDEEAMKAGLDSRIRQ